MLEGPDGVKVKEEIQVVEETNKLDLAEKEDLTLQFQARGPGRGYVGTVDERKLNNDDL